VLVHLHINGHDICNGLTPQFIRDSCAQVMRSAAVVSSDLDVLLQQQHSTTLPALQLSAAFSSWRSWAAARTAARSSYHTAKQGLTRLRKQHVVAAWHAAAVQQGAAAAALVVLQQRSQVRTLAKAFRGWVMMLSGWQVQQAKLALAVLWSARVMCARVLVVWAGVARRAAAIKAAVASRSGSSSGAAGSASFRLCSSSFTEALQQQQAWKVSMQEAVKGAMQRHEDASAAADAAVTDVNSQMPSAQAAVGAVLRQRQQQREVRAAEQVQQLQRELEEQAALLAAGGGDLVLSASQLSVGLSAESSSSSWLSVCDGSRQADQGAKEATAMAAAAAAEAQYHDGVNMMPKPTAALTSLRAQRRQQQLQQPSRGAQQQQHKHPYHTNASGGQGCSIASGSGIHDSLAPCQQQGSSSGSPLSLAYMHQSQQPHEDATGTSSDHGAAAASDRNVVTAVDHVAGQQQGGAHEQLQQRGARFESAAAAAAPRERGAAAAAGQRASSSGNAQGVSTHEAGEAAPGAAAAGAQKVRNTTSGQREVEAGPVAAAAAGRTDRANSSTGGQCTQEAAAHQVLLNITKRQQQQQHSSAGGSSRTVHVSPHSAAAAAAGVADDEEALDNGTQLADDDAAAASQRSTEGVPNVTEGPERSWSFSPELMRADAVASISRRQSLNQNNSARLSPGAATAGNPAAMHPACKAAATHGATATAAATAEACGDMNSLAHVRSSSSSPTDSMFSSDIQPLQTVNGQLLALHSCSSRRRASDAVDQFACRKLCSRALQGLMLHVQQRQQQRQIAEVNWKRAVQRRTVQEWAAEMQQLQRSRFAAVLR
jgi:hypothetical protein